MRNICENELISEGKLEKGNGTIRSRFIYNYEFYGVVQMRATESNFS